ncbi:DUF1697 domain-containing protein [Sphingobacterium shayense]|uniref:DUF1697 domain-containing protein n=1 Tax=Sphingobacterium shayense TaxID=626343 RepID=UPI0015516D61|nr:DUF1697 domain-containing protein [Sphingobacterium shayense]NQD70565.1 DUF1697 domain-containing protein [Sphingobacterium shayense]
MDKSITYIILLRAVNVSGKNIIKMADLKAVLINAGFTNVLTYIQSGNIILDAFASSEEVQHKIQHLLKESFELDIKVFVRNNEQLQSIVQNIPSRQPIEPNKLYITFIDKTPSKNAIDTLSKIDFAPEWFFLDNSTLYFYLPNGAAKTKLSNSFFERKLQVNATGRNLNTVKKLIELSQN